MLDQRSNEDYFADVEVMIQSEAARLACGTFVVKMYEANYNNAFERVKRDLGPGHILTNVFDEDKQCMHDWLLCQRPYEI